ncbi:CYTH domain-containing protein [Chitinibacter bivalviorum]|uniref:CYTH domain-containing protein n=1 Tax=Chitinibacter bivalviorum TaxID=2739434 RepID=A0A7H9BKK5_9NEIS|nr:CYTH domain-containing protein [Chitinibacter bivalviorum]QLG89200.1 CYTH domain-containing protein [Chitinibacter bivalviorum]
MAIEIERKFLLNNQHWREQVSRSTRIAQGYLNAEPSRTVRVRVKGDSGFITIKGKNEGISRVEFEYEIPAADALELLKLCPNVLDKTRHLVNIDGHTFEIDEFHGLNNGLIVAEIELASENASYPQPDWLGPEVSGDVRYYNSALSEKPFSSW